MSHLLPVRIRCDARCFGLLAATLKNLTHHDGIIPRSPHRAQTEGHGVVGLSSWLTSILVCLRPIKSDGHNTLHQEFSNGVFSSSDLHWIRFGLQTRLSIAYIQLKLNCLRLKKRSILKTPPFASVAKRTIVSLDSTRAGTTSANPIAKKGALKML